MQRNNNDRAQIEEINNIAGSYYVLGSEKWRVFLNWLLDLLKKNSFKNYRFCPHCWMFYRRKTKSFQHHHLYYSLNDLFKFHQDHKIVFFSLWIFYEKSHFLAIKIPFIEPKYRRNPSVGSESSCLSLTEYILLIKCRENYLLFLKYQLIPGFNSIPKIEPQS